MNQNYLLQQFSNSNDLTTDQLRELTTELADIFAFGELIPNMQQQLVRQSRYLDCQKLVMLEALVLKSIAGHVRERYRLILLPGIGAGSYADRKYQECPYVNINEIRERIRMNRLELDR